ncbi:MAG: HNH endonuclease [Persicimonas sp.]
MVDTARALDFATQLFELVERTRTNSTYKYALLLALIDCCQESFQKDGSGPQMLTTRQVAEKVLELYWHQARQHPELGEVKQNQGAQARIVSVIGEFQRTHAKSTSVFAARLGYPSDYARLLSKIEWRLIEEPLPRLQSVGDAEHDILYQVHWTASDVRKQKRASGVSAYQKRYQNDPQADLWVSTDGFDNRIMLNDDVGDMLVRLAPLFRPLVRREWTRLVARLNDVETDELERFLFASFRQNLTQLCEPLRDVQEGRCFYCEGRMSGDAEVDHFVAWSRCPNDDLYNLVLAHPTCNNAKSDHLAALPHLRRWVRRFDSSTSISQRISDVARDIEWQSEPDRSLAVSRSIYLPLPPGTPLWLEKRDAFERANPREIQDVLQQVEV